MDQHYVSSNNHWFTHNLLFIIREKTTVDEINAAMKKVSMILLLIMKSNCFFSDIIGITYAGSFFDSHN